MSQPRFNPRFRGNPNTHKPEAPGRALTAPREEIETEAESKRRRQAEKERQQRKLF